jgi:hypothetical protein
MFCSWRGRDVDKTSPAFAIAIEIISRAQKLCFEAHAPVSGIQALTKFFFDNSKTLLGSKTSSVAADLEMLSHECTRLLSSQPMVVKTHGDTKVFGDTRIPPPPPPPTPTPPSAACGPRHTPRSFLLKPQTGS